MSVGYLSVHMHIYKYIYISTFKAGTSLQSFLNTREDGRGVGHSPGSVTDSRLSAGVCCPPWLHTGNHDRGCCNSHGAGRQQTRWKPSQEEERLSFCSDISKYSLTFPYLSLGRHGRDRRGEFTRYSFSSLLAFSYKHPQTSFKKGTVPNPRGVRSLAGKFGGNSQLCKVPFEL